jgi:rubrerythrin
MLRTLGVMVVVALALTAAAGEAASSATLDNLQKAYANGLLAKARCEAFAAKADAEGYAAVGALLRAAANAEAIHLDKYAPVIKSLGGTPEAAVAAPKAGTTAENLKTLLEAVQSNKVAYAGFVKQAQTEKVEKAVMFLKGALADEASRGKLYAEAAGDLQNWKAAGKVFIVCQVCGYTTADIKLKTCPVCSAPRSKFSEFK